MNHEHSLEDNKIREVRYNKETDLIELVTTYSDTGKVVIRPMIPPKKNRDRVAWAVGWYGFRQPHEYATLVQNPSIVQRPCGIFRFAHGTGKSSDKKFWTCRFRDPYLDECIHTIEICQKNPVFFNYDGKLIDIRMEWMINQMKKELEQNKETKKHKEG